MILHMEIPNELRINENEAINYTVKWVRDYFKPLKTKRTVVGLSGVSSLIYPKGIFVPFIADDLIV